MHLTSLFPFDPSIDTSLGRRHLIIAYFVVGAVQVSYLCYLLRQWKSAAASEPGAPGRSKLLHDSLCSESFSGPGKSAGTGIVTAPVAAHCTPRASNV